MTGEREAWVVTSCACCDCAAVCGQGHWARALRDAEEWMPNYDVIVQKGGKMKTIRIILM